jgi:GT2 family glycosyltransferase
VLLLNNDPLVKPGFVDSLVKAMEESEDIFSVSAQMLSMEDESILDGAGDGYCILGWAYARGKGCPASKYAKKTEVFSACGGAAIYRKSILEEIGCFDENHFAYLEDVDIGYRARIYGYRSIYEPAAKVIHAGSGASGSRYNEFKTKLASANSAYVAIKNLPIVLLILNAPFLFLGFLVKACFFARKKMGILYIKGYFKGIKRGFSKEGRKHHVVFKGKNLLNYLKLEVWQILGTIGYLIKY